MKTLTPWLVLSFAFIISAILIGRSYNYKHKKTELISVTGSADTNFVSDLAVWTGSFARVSFNMQEAYNALKNDELIVTTYLKNQSVSDKEIRISAISTDKLFDYRYDQNGNQAGSEFRGYKLSETITVESADLAKVDKISRDITQLIQQGVELTSSAPDYYYTKLGDLKIGLLAKASADGQKRAETIAKNAKSALGNLHKASMGVFQITGQNMNEDYSFGGVFNTSSINKTATVTVKMEFDVK